MTGTITMEQFDALLDGLAPFASKIEQADRYLIVNPDTYRAIVKSMGMVTGRHKRAKGARARKRARMASIRCWRFSA